MGVKLELAGQKLRGNRFKDRRLKHNRNYIGVRFGRLVAIQNLGKDDNGDEWYLCLCDCGNEKRARITHLTHGGVQSCNCLLREVRILNAEKCHEVSRSDGYKHNTTHGESHSAGGNATSEYISWASAKNRCTNVNSDQWEYYGGAGVSMCSAWLNSYEAFLADVGRKPTPQHTLGRILDRGNYDSSNAFWQSRAEQSLNKKNNSALKKWEEAPTLAEAA